MSEKHILLVEDDEILQDLIKKLLTNNKYMASIAKNINEAEKLLKLFVFDLIILDVMLPDTSGLEFFKNFIKDRINTPVIFLSALSDVEDRVTGLELGANDYMGKPFDSRELLLKIKKNLSKNKALNIVSFSKDSVFDLKEEKLFYKNSRIKLSSNEIKILKLLINNSNQFLTRDLLNNEGTALRIEVEIFRPGTVPTSGTQLQKQRPCSG